MEIDIHDDVFNPVYVPLLNNQSRVQIVFGGSSSGKSKALAQRVIFQLLQGGHNFLICRQAKISLRGSVIVEVTKVIHEWGLEKLFNVNKTDGTITCINDYQVVFSGLDDVEKLKSIAFKKGVLTDIWVEEATETEYKSVKQLMKRQRGLSDVRKTLTLSFNPIVQSHWIYRQYFTALNWADDQREFYSDRLSILKTTYKDNRFLTQEDIDDLENEDDKYYYDVYTLGKWGILGDVIFPRVSVRDLSRMRAQFTNHRAGLDFGFADDPAAMPVMHYDRMRKTVYIFAELYERGLTNDMLALEIMRMIGSRPVVCDSAEPKSIKELKNLGVNARPAKKGKDSVNFGIQWLQQQNIIIDSSCVNAKHEFTTYHWKKDKDGHAMKVPAEKDNHLIDAARYALESDMTSIRAKAAKVDLYSVAQEQPGVSAARSQSEIDSLLQESNYV